MHSNHVGDVAVVEIRENASIPLVILSVDDLLELVAEQLTDIVREPLINS